LNNDESEKFRSQFENQLIADQEIHCYCANPVVIRHEPDDPLWIKMLGIAVEDKSKIREGVFYIKFVGMMKISTACFSRWHLRV